MCRIKTITYETHTNIRVYDTDVCVRFCQELLLHDILCHVSSLKFKLRVFSVPRRDRITRIIHNGASMNNYLQGWSSVFQSAWKSSTVVRFRFDTRKSEEQNKSGDRGRPDAGGTKTDNETFARAGVPAACFKPLLPLPSTQGSENIWTAVLNSSTLKRDRCVAGESELISASDYTIV